MANALTPIPMPILGLNTVNPYLNYDSGYARELTNYLIGDGKITVRPAVRSVSYNSGFGANSEVRWFDVQGFLTSGIGVDNAILHDGRIVTISSGALLGNIGGTCQIAATTVNHLSLNLLVGCRAPRTQFSPFGTTGPTTTVLVGTAITSGCSHRGRLYYSDGTGVVEYSSVGQIVGAMPAGNTFDFTPFLGGQGLLRMFSLTAQPGLSTESLFVVMGSGGKVLIYGGDFPAAATWQLLGSFDLPAPISNVGFVEIDGDIFVATVEYCYWVRTLFSSGVAVAYQNSPSAPIENLWRSFRYKFNFATDKVVPFAAYIPAQDIIIVCPYNYFSLDLTQIAVYSSPLQTYAMVYHRKFKAWSFWFSTPYRWPVTTAKDISSGIPGTIAAAISGEVVNLNQNIITDQTAGVNYITITGSWKIPYINPFKGTGVKVNGARVWYENTESRYFFKVRSIFDFTDANTPLSWYAQPSSSGTVPGNYSDGSISPPLPEGSAQQYNYLIPVMGVGGGVSFQFSQQKQDSETVSQSQSIYAASAWVEDTNEVIV